MASSLLTLRVFSFLFLLQLLPPSISSSIASSTTASSSRPQPAGRVRHLQLHHDSSTTRGNHHQQQRATMERPPHQPWGWLPRQTQPDFRFRWSSNEIIVDELDELDSFTRATSPDRPWGWRPHQAEPVTRPDRIRSTSWPRHTRGFHAGGPPSPRAEASLPADGRRYAPLPHAPLPQ